VREFATSLNGVVGKGGNIAKSINVAITPIAFKLRMSPDYQSNAARRVWENTQFSLATVFNDKADGMTASRQRVALGVSVPLFDRSDPRLATSEWGKCIARSVTLPIGKARSSLLTGAGKVVYLEGELDALKKKVPPIQSEINSSIKELNDAKETVEVLSEQIVELKKNAATARTTCLKEHQDAAKNASALTVAFAQTWSDAVGAKPVLERDARFAWLNYRGGFVDGQRYVLQARVAFDAIADGTDPIAERRYDARQIAARYAFEEAENWHLSLAGAKERRIFDKTGKREDVRTFIGSADFKLAKDTWLRLSVGRKHSSDGTSEPVVNATFDWGFAKKSMLDANAKVDK
jgi:hypothetical protein